MSLEVRAGEILGLAGVAGNGQSELLEVLGGYRKASGSITLSGEEIPLTGSGANGQSRRNIGISHVPEDRQREGLIMEFTAWENIPFGYHHSPEFQRNRLLMNNKAVRTETAASMERFDVRPPDPRLRASGFSGGNQQKIVVAREIERNPDCLLYTSPSPRDS